MGEPAGVFTRRSATVAAATLAALLFVGGVAVCGNVSSPVAPVGRSGAASALVVLEGLPHQRFEADVLASELAAEATVTHGGFPFYESPVAVPADVAALISKVLGDAATFDPHTPGKKCGGFHPDWFVSVGDGWSAKTYLICFGCEEVIVGEGLRSTTFDIADGAYKELAAALPKLRTNRPEVRMDRR